ncbi:hypothetical protein [Calidithermus chliarophilus]|uniref:hypothetical protein n=1 Tax=Calidithermus chliarophilus TaxID=52023 RepID=UPI00041E2C5C|nr:hypothetical protein [Calidithermus chliarophilus]
MISRTLPRAVSGPILLVAWGVWLAGLVAVHGMLPLGTAIANLLAAQGLYSMARRMPQGLALVLQGLALGLAVLALGDLALTYHWLFGVRASLDPLFLSGTAVFGVAGAGLPWAVERLGLHRRGLALRVSALAAGGAGVLTAVVTSLELSTPVQPVYYFVPFFLTLLFLLEVRGMINDRIKRALRNVVWALVLVGVARVVALFAGDQDYGSNLNLLNQALYGLFWLGGMSLLAWNTSR